MRLLLDRHFLAPEVWLADAALSELLVEADGRTPLETGGVLLGYWSEDSSQALIQSSLGPGPQAKHERYRFTPDADWQHSELAKAYASSGRVTTYLGDWHTHPGGVPSPSRRDRRTARAIARTPAARTRHPLMLIVGGGAAGEWRAQLHVWADRRLHAVDMQFE